MSGVQAIHNQLQSVAIVTKVFASQEDATDWFQVPIKGAVASVRGFGTGTVLLEQRYSDDPTEVITVWSFADTNDAADNIRVIQPVTEHEQYRLRASDSPSGSPVGRISF